MILSWIPDRGGAYPSAFQSNRPVSLVQGRDPRAEEVCRNESVDGLQDVKGLIPRALAATRGCSLVN